MDRKRTYSLNCFNSEQIEDAVYLLKNGFTEKADGLDFAIDDVRLIIDGPTGWAALRNSDGELMVVRYDDDGKPYLDRYYITPSGEYEGFWEDLKGHFNFMCPEDHYWLYGQLLARGIDLEAETAEDN